MSLSSSPGCLSLGLPRLRGSYDYTYNTTYTMAATYPVTANLNLEIWSGSTKVASSYSTTAKPETVTATAQPAGLYTIKGVSADYAAAYNLSATYPMLAYADLSLGSKTRTGNTLGKARSSTGMVSFASSVPAAG